MDRPTFNHTLTFMVSAGMVSASLAAAQQRVGSSNTLPSLLSDSGGLQCGLDCGAWGMESTGSAISTPGGGLGSGQVTGKQLAEPCPATCVDDTSPISSSSRFMHLQGAGSLTPSSVESCGLVVPDTSQQQQQLGLQQHQQLARLLVVQRQQLEVKKQLVQLPQHRQPCSAVPSATAGPAGKAPSAQWAWPHHALLVQQPQQQQQQLLTLLPQSSGGSLTSSSSLISSLPGASTGPDSVTSSSSAAATATSWQQLLRHQQLQLLQQQPAQQQVQLIARPLMQGSTSVGGSVLVKRPTPVSSMDQQPAAKKAATQAAVAAMLQQVAQTAAAWRAAAPQPQQQLVLLPQAAAVRPAAQPWNAARLPPTGLVRQRQQQQQLGVPTTTTLALVAAPAAVSAALAGPARVLESAQQKLLSWAGRVLNCQLQDAYLLGCHLYRRVSGQLDDMLLISLGVSASTESVTMLVSLWVASKLEGHRRQVAGASKLAAALQLLPGSITDIELHVMQRLQWQPYAGWAARLFE